MTPLVSIILTHHLDECAEYLKHAIEGCLWQWTNFDFELIVMSDAKSKPTVPNDPRLLLFHDEQLGNASDKFNYAMANLVHPASQYILLHSDDVCMGVDCLQVLFDRARDANIPLIQNPLSNSDSVGKYYMPLTLGGVRLGPDIDLETLRDKLPLLRESRSGLQDLLVPFQYVSFYCTLIPRSLINQVGPLDRILDLKNNDLDYCLRAARFGAMAMVNFGAFAIHFGSKTLSKIKQPGDDIAADDHFKAKWTK